MKPYLRSKTVFEQKDIPSCTAFEAGYLITKNSGWRSMRPIVDAEKCVRCMQCYLYCPDGVIFEARGTVQVDYDFCKGCGICEKICKIGAIKMEDER